MGRLVEFNNPNKIEPQEDYNKFNPVSDKSMNFMNSFVVIPMSAAELIYLKSIIDKQFNEDEVAMTYNDRIFRILSYGLENIEKVNSSQVLTLHLVQLKYLYKLFQNELSMYEEGTKEKSMTNRILNCLTPKVQMYKRDLDRYSNMDEKLQYNIMDTERSAFLEYKYKED